MAVLRAGVFVGGSGGGATVLGAGFDALAAGAGFALGGGGGAGGVRVGREGGVGLEGGVFDICG